jgi:ABC-2 type transport system permease protein
MSTAPTMDATHSTRSALPIYLRIAAMWPRLYYVYRANLIFSVVSVLLQIFLLKIVWTAVYAGQGIVGGTHLSALIVYLTLANLQLWILQPAMSGFMQQRVRSGQIAFDLARPVSFLGQMLANQIGSTAGVLPFIVIAIPLAFFLGGLQVPATLIAGAAYVVSLILAYVITMMIDLILGLIAFWTLELTGLLWIYRFVSQFFAGALIPLQFFPSTLAVVAVVLPFQAQAYLPISIYLGRLQGVAIIQALGVQLFWAVASYGLARLVLHGAIRRVVIQGG